MKGVKIPAFEWSEIDGKTLKIKISEDEENGVKVTVVIGQDEETGRQYLIRHSASFPQTKKVTPCP